MNVIILPPLLFVAAAPLDLATVGTVLGIAVLVAGAAAVFRTKSLREALATSQETVKTLLTDKAVQKEDREAERARWELKVEALEAKIVVLESTVTGLEGQIVGKLIEAAKAALAIQATAAKAALDTQKAAAKEARNVKQATKRRRTARSRRA